MNERNPGRGLVGDGCCGSQLAPRQAAWWRGRRIGPWGTATRAASGIVLLVLALAFRHDHPWLGLPGAGSPAFGLLAGLVVLPGLLMVAARLRGRSAPPLRAHSHGVACGVTAVVVVLWQIFPIAVFTFIGVSLLSLAVRGDDGCEVLAMPNWLLGRRDYLVCLPFTPLDRWESGRRAREGRESDGRTAEERARQPQLVS